MPKPYELTGRDFVGALDKLPARPPLFQDYRDLFGVEGPRVVCSGLLPYPRKRDGAEIDALIWPDLLILVSKRVFRALGGIV